MVGVSTLVPSAAPRLCARQRAQPRHRGRGVPAVVTPWLEVVGDGDRLQTELLREEREVERSRVSNCSADAL